MKKLKLFFTALIPALALLAGLGLICWGFAKLYLPAGFVVGGIFLLVLAHVMTRTKKT
jgi:hypothetical protein